MKKRILVTGGSGFIGTNIIDFYKEENSILNLDIKKPRNPNQEKYWQEIDILDREKLAVACKKFEPDFIFHMAARTDLDGKNLVAYKANTEGVENIINACKKLSSLKKIIFASSRLVCEIGYKPKDEFDYKPSTLYGESKIIGEKIVRESKNLKTDWIIVRPTSLWGPWFDVPYKNFFDTIMNKRYFHPRNKKIYKKFGFVKNCVFILDFLLKDAFFHKKTIYLSDFKDLEVQDWANKISQNFHHKNVKTIPVQFLRILAFFGTLLKKIGYNKFPLTIFRLGNILTNMHYNIKEVENKVGTLPYKLEDAIEITCDWYKNDK